MATVTEAITCEIERLHVEELSPGLAQLAISLAGSVDEPGGPTAKANAARELRAVMEDLRKLAPVAPEMDRVDELAQRREDGLVRARRA
ncbi:hypothetical protein OG693_39720 (plasmid) [Streptomyces sp. NBC_01259]|uniref:hypothetical protein n=1 Tax=Streptomyces sp. NBC_01259 TaxID=2903800 RepID=UPI002F916A32